MIEDPDNRSIKLINEEERLLNKYNFDEVIQRKNTNSLKYDFAVEKGKSEDLLPLWVADMDFKTDSTIIKNLEDKVRHGIYGYSDPKSSYYNTLIDWMEKRHEWKTKREWYFYTPGVVFAIGLAIRSLTEEGDAVLIQRPVYYPFTSIIIDNNRKLINNPLVYSKNINNSKRYSMDLKDFENKIVDEKVKLFILCNPHNPVGRVWTREELEGMGDICRKHNVIVVADEIHQDFIYQGFKHLVFADLKPEYKEFTITCTSPSKTFNLAGLQVSNIITANATYKKAMQKEMNKTGYDNMNLFGLIATETAYKEGELWLEELKLYLNKNLDFIREFLRTRLPKIKLVEPEGTYLVWIDCSELGYSSSELKEVIVDKAKLWLDSGVMFGKEGHGFERINIATSRINLEKALVSLEKALS